MTEEVKDVFEELGGCGHDLKNYVTRINDAMVKFEDLVADDDEEESFEDNLKRMELSIVDENNYDFDVTHFEYSDFHKLSLTIDTTDMVKDFIENNTTVYVKDQNDNDLDETEVSLNENGIHVRVIVPDNTNDIEKAAEKRVEEILADKELFIKTVEAIEQANFAKRMLDLGVKDIEDLKKRLQILKTLETLFNPTK